MLTNKTLRQVKLTSLVDVDFKTLPYEIDAIEIEDLKELKENIPTFGKVMRVTEYNCVIWSSDVKVAKTINDVAERLNETINFYLTNNYNENIDIYSFKNLNLIIQKRPTKNLKK